MSTFTSEANHEFEYDTTPREAGGKTGCCVCGKESRHPIHRTSKERLSDANLEYHSKSDTYDLASMAQELIERRAHETPEPRCTVCSAPLTVSVVCSDRCARRANELKANAQKADEHRHGAAQDFVSYDPCGGVRVDMARYLRSPAGQAQLALGGKKASE